jgi:peptidoglycan/xylan/chitin deacetylase (PgdA/CDA1 family)
MIDSTGQFDVLTITNSSRITNVGVPILMYHNVDSTTPTGNWVTTANFTQQMDYLNNNGYTTITGKELFDYIFKGIALPIKPVWITIDDAYQNIYENAYPVLQARNQRASIFVPTQVLGQMNVWDLCCEPQHPHMSWEMVRRMTGSNIADDGHTRGHVHLTALNWSAQQGEIWGTSRDLMDNTGRPSTTFSYPYGEYGDATVWLAAHSGFRGAVTTRSGKAYTDLADVYTLNRIYIQSTDTLSNFVTKLTQP